MHGLTQRTPVTSDPRGDIPMKKITAVVERMLGAEAAWSWR
ncbi:unannotated protein [freshwater metagenome]|uniref:Unannotated protein n=1 Tax=freshwater metagenome TaxID=449393 RepID=A0A6J7I9Q9_9ZZZZ